MSTETRRPVVIDDHPVVVGTAVMVDGPTASQLADALKVLEEAYRNRGGLDQRLLDAAEAFRLAGDRWHFEDRRRYRNRNLGTSLLDEEVILKEMRTSDVAERLGVSDRAVTKRAVALGGRKVGHRWLYDRTTVALAARQREECNGQ